MLKMQPPGRPLTKRLFWDIRYLHVSQNRIFLNDKSDFEQSEMYRPCVNSMSGLDREKRDPLKRSSIKCLVQSRINLIKSKYKIK